jgi:ribonuclease T1
MGAGVTCMAWLARRLAALLFAVACAAPSPGHAGDDTVPVHQLPQEAVEMLGRIERGGPYRYERDGTVFGNRERLLPRRARGYYREYTVDTPGVRHRGARRLVVGCEREPPASAHGRASPSRFPAFAECGGPAEVYYTEDHYRSFRRVLP